MAIIVPETLRGTVGQTSPEILTALLTALQASGCPPEVVTWAVQSGNLATYFDQAWSEANSGSSAPAIPTAAQAQSIASRVCQLAQAGYAVRPNPGTPALPAPPTPIPAKTTTTTSSTTTSSVSKWFIAGAIVVGAGGMLWYLNRRKPGGRRRA